MVVFLAIHPMDVQMQLNSAALVSAQMHVQTWGQMGAGDMLLSNFGEVMALLKNTLTISSRIHRALLQGSGVTFQGSYRRFRWSFLVLRHSVPIRCSGAASGMHVDDFVLFAVEKVDEYTLDVNCDNPVGGYTTLQTQFCRCIV